MSKYHILQQFLEGLYFLIKEKINFLEMDRISLEKFFLSIGEKSFRAMQIMKWIYFHYCDDFKLMTDIKSSLRFYLDSIATISAPKIVERKNSFDGTIKWKMRLYDSKEIETVFIPEKTRGTICVSSQVGCLLGCKFCATSMNGFKRNLKTSEIVGQIWRIKKIIDTQKNMIKNVVFMGMGEPLLNLKNLISSIRIISDNFGFSISKKKITVSTVGIPFAIKKLSENVDVSLAFSLHAPTNNLRNKIIPINKKYDISSCLSSINKFLRNSNIKNKKVTIEYVMIDGINDTIQHARQLVKCINKTPNKINLIPLNRINNLKYSFTRSKEKNIFIFQRFLIDKGFVTTVRNSRGEDIHAACGQLIGKIYKK
ncbi:hypothetical protein AOQ88_01155 [Candidatus Riesia sp. GBBU]|nr:hypothetical protein AOQ88_01155 [Candidatus Riesia sp. GBBU]